MVRRYGEQVEVRSVVDGAVGVPTSFLWRDRLYVVRDVLGHWRERRAWWAAPAALAVHGDDPPGLPERGDGSGPSLGEEHEVWRVEASRGRSHGAGVYDLCHDLSAGLQAPSGAWRLLRVAD